MCCCSAMSLFLVAVRECLCVCHRACCRVMACLLSTRTHIYKWHTIITHPHCACACVSVTLIRFTLTHVIFVEQYENKKKQKWKKKNKRSKIHSSLSSSSPPLSYVVIKKTSWLVWVFNFNGVPFVCAVGRVYTRGALILTRVHTKNWGGEREISAQYERVRVRISV